MIKSIGGFPAFATYFGFVVSITITTFAITLGWLPIVILSFKYNSLFGLLFFAYPVVTAVHMGLLKIAFAFSYPHAERK